MQLADTYFDTIKSNYSLSTFFICCIEKSIQRCSQFSGSYFTNYIIIVLTTETYKHFVGFRYGVIEIFITECTTPTHLLTKTYYVAVKNSMFYCKLLLIELIRTSLKDVSITQRIKHIVIKIQHLF